MEQNKYNEGSVITVDKPYGWSSFRVVKRLRWLTGAKKVGHAGTLDPLATGLLILCTGKFTKKIVEFQDMGKVYSGTFELGATTASFDLETEVEPGGDPSKLTEMQIKAATEKFIGEVDQTPPVFSAIKIDGQRAYKKARAGEHVEIKSRKVRIDSFEITKIDLPAVHFIVSCGKGTYIRSLARDFGMELGCGAYLSSLRRDQIGDFDVKDAKTPDEWAVILKKE